MYLSKWRSELSIPVQISILRSAFTFAQYNTVTLELKRRFSDSLASFVFLYHVMITHLEQICLCLWFKDITL